MRRFATILAVLAGISFGGSDAKACHWFSRCQHTCVIPTNYVYYYSYCNPAWLYITVPEGSKLYFTDTLAAQTSGTIAWYTPYLLYGHDYQYRLKVVLKDGKEITRIQRLRAGEVVYIDFTKPSSETVASR